MRARCGIRQVSTGFHIYTVGTLACLFSSMIGLKGTLNVWQNVFVNARKADYSHLVHR